MQQALATGYACLAAWSDLVDSINVFPVADGDTGTNLRISLAPMQGASGNREELITRLNHSAIGNSGNIAVAFFKPFIEASDMESLIRQATRASNSARNAVAEPREGTMLTLFDTLAAGLVELVAADKQERFCALCYRLRQAVLAGTDSLPELQEAHVVDAGALAMFLFFHGYFGQLAGHTDHSVPVFELFAGRLAIRHPVQSGSNQDHCVEATLLAENLPDDPLASLADLGKSLVSTRDGERMKLHIHTPAPEQVRAKLVDMGRLTAWSEEKIDSGRTERLSRSDRRKAVHIMTDAAGSLSRTVAQQQGITLLDSYLVINGLSRPESLCPPDELYSVMRTRQKVSTAQAPLAERYLRFESTCQCFGKTLYLCVGSAFTSNYDTALNWKQDHDPDNLLTVMDTGAASGRLALITLLTSRLACRTDSVQQVTAQALELAASCQEYIFLHELRYLAASGRIAKLTGFFGDLLQKKPVITPTADGVRKVGLVSNAEEQIDFALAGLKNTGVRDREAVLLLQYTDNRSWVMETVLPILHETLPGSEILVQPLSLTAGAHMGPGTWALAWHCGDQ